MFYEHNLPYICPHGKQKIRFNDTYMASFAFFPPVKCIFYWQSI